MLDSDYVLELLQENGFVTKEQVDEGWKKSPTPTANSISLTR